MIVDLGTGDGRAVLAAAAQDPQALALGIDANAASMAESSRRAARSAVKGGLPNALFIASAVEALSEPLAQAAHLVTITFPWGSLLRGVLGLDVDAASAIARLPRPGGRIVALLSVTDRDRTRGLPALDAATIGEVEQRHAAHGLEVVSARLATMDEVRATRSSWAGRLGARTGQRDVWRLELRREG